MILYRNKEAKEIEENEIQEIDVSKCLSLSSLKKEDDFIIVELTIKQATIIKEALEKNKKILLKAPKEAV